MRSGGSFGSKPPVLPKSPRILRTSSVDKHRDTDTVNIPTPIGKDSACDTHQPLNVNAGGGTHRMSYV